jgi:glycine/D-amino acid oxidase-like deaminating enzyme
MPTAVVIGAGVFGAALADCLAGAGWDVVLVEREEPGGTRAASGDRSRALRFAHGPDEWHPTSARRSAELWRELDPDLLVRTGAVWLAGGEDAWERQSLATLERLGIPAERIEVADAARLLPGLRGDDLRWALWEPDAGVLRAARATRALTERALRRGARLDRGEARPDGDAAVVGGERLEADRVVWACGAWLAKLFPGLVRLTVTRQETWYLRGPDEWRSPPVPAWLDSTGAHYGWGDLGGQGIKTSSDALGPEWDPDGDRTPAAGGERGLRDYLRRRFPALADAPLLGTHVCQYAKTPDSRFILAPHPEHERVWIAGGDSGHGFKHGPALAELLLPQLAGEEPPDPRFSLAPRDPAAEVLRAAEH